MNRLNCKKARNKLGVTEPVLSVLTQSGFLGYTSTTGLFSDQAILSYQQFGTQWEVDERFGPTWRMIEETTYDGLPPIESIGPQPPATRIHMYVCSAGQRDPRHPAETMNTDTGWIAHFYLASNYFYFPNPTELSLVGLPPLKLSEPRPVLGANLPVTLYPHPSGCLGLVVVEGLNRPLKGATHEAYDVAVPLLDELSARYDVPLPVAHTMVVGVPTGVIHLEFGHRPKAKQIDSESKILSRCPHPELRDAYALYREAVSSNNPFHSFLAFWKVYKEAVYVRKAWGAQHQRSDTRVGEEGFPDLFAFGPRPEELAGRFENTEMPEDQLRGEKFEKAKKMLNGPYRVALAHAGYVDAGKPPIFVSHGTRDGVLPIERCSRRIVPQLDREGYKVRYREFDADLDSRSVSAR